MKKIGLGLDYNNICKNYNTVYLDRDNDDRATVTCMKEVLVWSKALFSELLEAFEYNLYRMNYDIPLDLGEIVQKRFFFYSLEKEIIAQTFILQKDNKIYGSLKDWSSQESEGVVIQNDDEGEGMYLYCNEGSAVHQWLMERLSDCSLDDIPLEG